MTMQPEKTAQYARRASVEDSRWHLGVLEGGGAAAMRNAMQMEKDERRRNGSDDANTKN